MSQNENGNAKASEILGSAFWPGENKPVFSFEAVRQRLSALLGETLTVIDASIHDQVSRKAVKDLIKRSFYASMGEMDRHARIVDPEGHGSTARTISLEENKA